MVEVVSVLSFGQIETEIGILLHIISQTRYFGQLDVAITFSAFLSAIYFVSTKRQSSIFSAERNIWAFYFGYHPCFWVKLNL